MYYQHFQTVSSSGGFLETFLAELLASLVVAVLGATLIPAYLDWRKKPKLEFKNRATRTNAFTLTRAQDGQGEGTFALVIRNEGAVAQREVFWHLLFPNELQVSVISYETGTTLPSETLQGAGRTWRHIGGKLTDPIFAKKGLIFPYKLVVKTPTSKQTIHSAYYFFSTEFGTSPATAEKFHEMEAALGRNADGLLDPEDLGKIILQPQDDRG